MIKLEKIKKNYRVGSNLIHALKGVDITFRNSEFVAILGPSGCGKTTLLNIIGGLDHCTKGNLIINGKSTEKFNDKDWDSYRNHSIGFVFQSYNLIPHQTVLANVELALTISGISRKEREERAKKALISVGLDDQFDKKPNQLSGGQMQRVAIARAIVNDPDILLADEPTGALDSETSVQIMDIIKEIAKDRLVVMVTHNPELAEQYATRIVKLMDGSIVSDSNPITEEIDHREFIAGKTIMNFFTALSLSFNNLLTKKARTVLTSFAGSIGIIGIALILALSTGINNYISEVQTNSLSSYPLTIENKTADFSSALISMMGEMHEESDNEEGTLKEVQVISKMFGSVETNDLKSFKEYFDENREIFDPLLTSVQYNYGTMLQIYKSDTTNEVTKLNPSSLLSSSSSGNLFSSYSYSNIFSEMMDNRELLESQYEVICGKWPNSYDECIIVIDSKSTVTDYFLYSLGIKDNAELQEIVKKLSKGEQIKNESEPIKITYDELLNLTFKVVNPSDCYQYNETYKIWEDMTEDDVYMKNVLEDSLCLKVVGIVSAREGVTSTALSSGVAYTSELANYMIEKAAESELVSQTLSLTDVDVFTGKTFDELNEKNSGTGIDFSSMITVDRNALSSAFGMNVSQQEIAEIINQYMNNAMNVEVNTIDLNNDLNATLALYFDKLVRNYITNHGTAGMVMIDNTDIQSAIDEFSQQKDCADLLNILETKYGITNDISKQFFDSVSSGILSNYYETMKNTGTLQQDKAILNETVLSALETALTMDEVQSAVQQFSEQLVSGKIQMNVGMSMSGLSTALITKMASSLSIDADKLAGAFKFGMDEAEISRLMNAFMTSDTSERSQSGNLQLLGYGDKSNPTSMSFYFKNFECKEKFKEIVDAYNENAVSENPDSKSISYSDLTGILMSSITTIIDAISYVLIAFVSVSLVVSSIMIAIITYISVLERTKEIGILRSLGASKKDVRHVFNAETFIIGLLSGVIGVGSTILLCFPISDIVRKLTSIPSITAVLPQKDAMVLIIISVILTMLAGLVPSDMASKCDPVIALRNE